MRTVVILTASPLCRNPRVVKEATTLGGAGYDVTVLTLATHERFARLDEALCAGLPFRRVALDYYGRGLPARARAWLRRAETRLARSMVTRFGFETAGALGPARALLALAMRHPADLTIVHTEIPTWVATRLHRAGRRIAVDFEDWYSEDLLPADRRGRPMQLLRAAEMEAFHAAAYVSATSQSMADGLRAAFGGAVPLVLRNVFPLQPIARPHRPAGDAPPRLVWFSQTIGPGRGLEAFVRAWARTATASQLVLLGDLRDGFGDTLQQSVPPERRQDLTILPPVPPGDLPTKLAEFDLGLALEQRVPRNRDLTITNKLFQYLNAGLAVIATDTAGQREVLHAHAGAGLLVESVDAPAFPAALDALLADRARWRAMQLASRAAAESELCWEREAPRLLAAVHATLGAP